MIAPSPTNPPPAQLFLNEFVSQHECYAPCAQVTACAVHPDCNLRKVTRGADRAVFLGLNVACCVGC